MEKQRNYLMRKLQQTKSSLETEKFRILKDFEMDKLEMLKKIEELLMLNDILIGQKTIYDSKGNKISTKEVMNILNPAIEGGKVTIREVVSKLTQKFLTTRSVGIQAKQQVSKSNKVSLS